MLRLRVPRPPCSLRGAAWVPMVGSAVLSGVASSVGAGSTALPRPAAAVAPIPASFSSSSFVAAAAAADGARPASCKPACVLVKVGDVGTYAAFTLSWEVLAAMRDIGLLKALCKTHAFGPLLQDVALAACRVYVLKGKLAKGKQEPDAADEAPGKVLELQGVMTLGEAAKAGRVGKWLFVRVVLPAHLPVVTVPAKTKRFQAALAAAKVKQIEAGCQLLVLPKDEVTGKPVMWPGMDSHILFVRPAFKQMYEETLQGFSEDVKPNDWTILMRGVPGIGKSSFGLYALWRLVTERPELTVEYEYPEGLGILTPITFGSGASEVYIVDGCKPSGDYLGRPTLLISAPRGDKKGKSVYSDYDKDADDVYMPEPTHHEIMLMAKYCFGIAEDNTDAKAAVRERMTRWGNIPRFVLARTKEEIVTLELAIGMQKIGALQEFAKVTDDALIVQGISFCVVHYVVSDDQHSVSYRWASPYVASKVYELLLKAHVQDRLALLHDLLQKKELLAMSHSLFEDWCNHLMSRGKTLRIRRLGVGSVAGLGKGVKLLKGPSAEALCKQTDKQLGVVDMDGSGCGKLVIPRVPTEVLQQRSQLPPASKLANKRVRPKSCFPAVDFIEAGGVCSNATVNAEHSLLLLGSDQDNGLLPVLTKLHPGVEWTAEGGGGPPVPFLWLVPPIIFNDMKAGQMKINYPRKEASPAVKQAHEERASAARRLAPWVVQYAVEIPGPEEGRQQQQQPALKPPAAGKPKKKPKQ